jgi:DNA-binding MarR family transcriptional regulator
MVQKPYYQSIVLIERLHRHFLELVKAELERRGIQDINNVQSLILYNIGTDELTVGELTARGYYLGSNVSYNVKKMVENGYLVQERSMHDRRSVRVRLSDKGLELREKLGAMFARHNDALPDAELNDKTLSDLNDTLLRLERFWSNRLGYAIGSGITTAA